MQSTQYWDGTGFPSARSAGHGHRGQTSAPGWISTFTGVNGDAVTVKGKKMGCFVGKSSNPPRMSSEQTQVLALQE